MVILPFVLRHLNRAGMFWCYKRDFDAIAGFDESLVCVEDVDFGVRLKKLERVTSRRYGTIWKGYMTTSCRKFDQYGDWFLARNPRLVYDIFHQSQKVADRLYYDQRSDGETR